MFAFSFSKSLINKITVREILLVNLTFFFFLFRTSYPLLKYPFIALFIVGLFYFSIKYRKEYIYEFSIFIRNFVLVFILLFLIVAAFLLSDKIYLLVFKDLVNTGILLYLFFLASLIVKSQSKLNEYIDSLIFVITTGGFFLSLLSLSEHFTILSFEDSVDLDYNFAILPAFFGILGVIYILIKHKTLKYKFIYYLCIGILGLQIYLSGSRRGFLVIVALTFILFLSQIILVLIRSKHLKTNKNRVYLYTGIVLSLVPILYYLFLFQTSYDFKKSIFSKIHVQNIFVVKHRITNRLSKNFAVLGIYYNPRELYKRIWDPSFESKDPDKGWGTRLHKSVFPLTGLNAEIVPEGSIGYCLDKFSDADTWEGNAYSYTKIWTDTVKSNEKIHATVYCYVSEDFDGDWIRISSEGSTSGLTEDYYKIEKKGEWQKLEILPFCNEGIASVYLYFAKYGVTNFSSLNGYVVFAYPQIDLTGNNQNFDPFEPESGWGSRIHRVVHPLEGTGSELIPGGAKGYLMDKTCNADTWDGNAYSYSKVDILTTRSSDKIEASVFCYVSDDFDGTWAALTSEGACAGIAYYDLKRKGTWQNLEFRAGCNEGEATIYLYFAKNHVKDFSTLKGYIIFANPLVSIISDSITLNDNGFSLLNKTVLKQSSYNSSATLVSLLQNIQIQKDPDHDFIRRLTTKFISEDTTYYGYKSDLMIGTISDSFIDPRLLRWEFALKIFFKEYGLTEKLFGGGFNFLNWFGYYFNNDKTLSDYPHNPLLSILLYSGVIGLILYLFFLYRTVTYYYMYFQNYSILLNFFLITLFFSFFSGGSPFDPPIMGFFTMIPFFIHGIFNKTRND